MVCEIPARMMETPYLCVLYVATAGQQGPNLGADEEEIVLLIYVMIDMTQNKVVGVTQYLVKPQVADMNENVLSEQIMSESGITEEMVKNGQPLEVVIQTFDQYVRATFHVGRSPHALRFVTDGQLPLRQCLHPEACSKNFELPPYYTAFHDLRKEFRAFYAAPEEMQSIPDMINYLSMKAVSESDLYIKDVQDMVNITQRMVADGHKFENPEVVNLRLEPGICSKNEEVDNNCVVRARGLPWQSSDQDIAKFFRGLNVAKGGVALCLSPQGRRNGEALVRFVNQEHRDMALKRHKHHIGNRYIEVYKANGEDFVNVAGGSNNEAQAFLSRGGQVIVRMRGLPYDCSAKQVLDFFESGENSCKVMDDEEGVLFVKKPDGRATGDAFVLFAQEEDAGKALSKHRDSIGSRYIELFRSTTAEVQQVLNRSMDPKTYEVPQPLIAQIPQVPLLPQHIITSGTRKDCIRLRGLPYEAQVEHILEFLGEHAKNIVLQGVHMVYNAQGQPSGEAFIQLDSEQSAYLCAQQKHHRYMIFGKKQRYIEVFQCSGEDMNLVLTGGLPAGAVSPAKAAALLSPGMLPPHPPPPHALNTANAALAPTPGAAMLHPPPALPQGTLSWEHSHPLVQAQVAAQVQQVHALAQAQAQAAALRHSQATDHLWIMNLAAAQQHQAAVAVALAAAASSNSNTSKQNSWSEVNGNAIASSSQTTNSTVSVSLPSTSTSSAASQKPLAGPPLVPTHTTAVYGPLIPHPAQFSSAAGHPPSATAAPPGLVFLNMPQRLPLGGNHLLPPQASGALNNPKNLHNQLAAASSNAPPGHGMLPHLMSPQAVMTLKRTWGEAFQQDLQSSGGLKRQWQPPAASGTTLAHGALPPTLAYQPQFFPAL